MSATRVSKRKSSPVPPQVEISEPSSPISQEMEPAQKKARVEAAPSFNDVVVSDIKFKLGRDEKTILAELDGEQITFNLTPEGSLKVVYGFDMEGVMEKRSFNSQDVEKAANESLAIRVKLSLPLIDFLEDLDSKCRMLHTEMNKTDEWIPLISYNEKYKTATVKLRVCLSGYCTALKVIDGTEIKRGRGWNFLKAFGQSFTQADAKAAVKLRVYRMNGKAGISLGATELFLKPNEQTERVETFADDVEW